MYKLLYSFLEYFLNINLKKLKYKLKIPDTKYFQNEINQKIANNYIKTLDELFWKKKSSNHTNPSILIIFSPAESDDKKEVEAVSNLKNTYSKIDQLNTRNFVRKTFENKFATLKRYDDIIIISHGSKEEIKFYFEDTLPEIITFEQIKILFKNQLSNNRKFESLAILNCGYESFRSYKNNFANKLILSSSFSSFNYSEIYTAAFLSHIKNKYSRDIAYKAGRLASSFFNKEPYIITWL